MKRCACLLVDVTKYIRQPNGDYKESKSKEYEIFHNLTPKKLRELREKGAVILHQTTERAGNTIHKYWRTDTGVPVIYSTEIVCHEQRNSSVESGS